MKTEIEKIKALVERKRLIEQMLIEREFRKTGNIKSYNSLKSNDNGKR